MYFFGRKNVDDSNRSISYNVKEDYHTSASQRLDYWIYINSLPAHSSIAFWSRSVDHRIIYMLAINASLNQLPDQYRNSKNQLSGVYYENIRRLCRCTDKTMRSIIQEGVDRGELEKTKIGRETYVVGTKKLLSIYEEFEEKWIVALKQNN